MPERPLANGWVALPMTESHTLHDGLYLDGDRVATVEAFSDDGPWYANAQAADGTEHRSGAARSHAAAAEWAERVTGYAVGRSAVGSGEGGGGGVDRE